MYKPVYKGESQPVKEFRDVPEFKYQLAKFVEKTLPQLLGKVVWTTGAPHLDKAHDLYQRQHSFTGDSDVEDFFYETAMDEAKWNPVRVLVVATSIELQAEFATRVSHSYVKDWQEQTNDQVRHDGVEGYQCTLTEPDDLRERWDYKGPEKEEEAA